VTRAWHDLSGKVAIVIVGIVREHHLNHFRC
jgi:hypothetical protein